MTKTNKVSAKAMNASSRMINERRNAAESICREFQAVWAKVYGDEFKAAQQNAIMAAQVSPTNDNKAVRRSLELVAAMKKSLTLSKEEIELIKGLHESGVTFDKIRLDKIMRGLTMTRYINESGELCERKKNKETNEYEFVPVQKWTVAKFGRFLRLSIIEVPTI